MELAGELAGGLAGQGELEQHRSINGIDAAPGGNLRCWCQSRILWAPFAIHRRLSESLQKLPLASAQMAGTIRPIADGHCNVGDHSQRAAAAAQ
jgi:hypothetical protein